MPLGDHVLDTNVLLVASASDPASPFKDSEHVPPAEQRVVLQWLNAFYKDSSRQLVLDEQQTLIREYRKKLTKNDFGYKVILEKWQTARARVHSIELDEAQDARLPEPLQKHVKDRADRKFVAVALKDKGRSTIVNACDTDWYDCEEALLQEGIVLTQLIDSWCKAKHTEKSEK